MSVWYCIPSARPNGGTIPLWRERGYRVAAYVDEGCEWIVDPADGFTMRGHYPGYALAVNMLVQQILQCDPQAEWIVTGGDDVEPDMNLTPETIARQCSDYFSGKWFRENKRAGADFTEEYLDVAMRMGTFGVVQPTGDRFAQGSIDRIAGSPWMGREWCLRANQGKGPLFEGYTHCFVDEELQEVAIKLGVFWQRRDLIHLHQHFQRASDDLHSPAVPKPMPAHLVRWNSPEHWDESKALFQSRKAAGFPGHEPLPVEVCA